MPMCVLTLPATYCPYLLRLVRGILLLLLATPFLYYMSFRRNTKAGAIPSMLTFSTSRLIRALGVIIRVDLMLTE